MKSFRRLRLRWTVAAFSALLLMPPLAAAADAVESTLGNGLRVIVKTDRRAPVVVSMIWYKAGSVDEPVGATGVAHVLEHMMFKGTRTTGPGEFSRIVATAGGRDNAFTSKDYTAYFVTLHKSHLELALKLEADRLANLALSPEEFAKEVKVVMEERRWRTDDRPRSLVYEQMNAAAYSAHPYRNPIIGWMGDLENMRVEDVQAFYERWYAPNNAFLVVIGDVAPEEVFSLAERHFGSLPAKTLPRRPVANDAPQLGPKRITVRAPAELPYLLMGYRVPSLRDPAGDWESYALEMLGGILDGGEAARLPRDLVRTQRLANSVNAGYDGIGRGPGMFYLSAVPSPGRSITDVEAALRAELRKIAEEGVAENELKRVKAQLVAARVYERDSMFAQGRQIGVFETANLSHRALDLVEDKLQAVTAEQVREVARKFFSDDVLTAAQLDPQPLPERKPLSPPPGVRHAQ